MESQEGVRDERRLRNRDRRQRQRRRVGRHSLDQRGNRLHPGILPARNTGFPAASIQNAAGKYEFPNLPNIEAAASVVKKVPANNELHIVNPPKSDKKAYPISTFSYAIVPKATAQPGEMSKFLLYAMGEGQQFASALDFAPIPKVVLKAGIATAKQLA